MPPFCSLAVLNDILIN